MSRHRSAIDEGIALFDVPPDVDALLRLGGNATVEATTVKTRSGRETQISVVVRVPGGSGRDEIHNLFSSTRPGMIAGAVLEMVERMVRERWGRSLARFELRPGMRGPRPDPRPGGTPRSRPR